MNTYSVLDRGKVIATGIPCKKVTDLTGVDQKAVIFYERQKKLCLDRYTFVVDGEVDDNHVHRLSLEMEKAWNEMLDAANLLKSGKGKIVTKNGKKYVEVI